VTGVGQRSIPGVESRFFGSSHPMLVDYRLQQSTRACDAFASPCSWMCLKGAAIYGGV